MRGHAPSVKSRLWRRWSRHFPCAIFKSWWKFNGKIHDIEPCQTTSALHTGVRHKQIEQHHGWFYRCLFAWCSYMANCLSTDEGNDFRNGNVHSSIGYVHVNGHHSTRISLDSLWCCWYSKPIACACVLKENVLHTVFIICIDFPWVNIFHYYTMKILSK